MISNDDPIFVSVLRASQDIIPLKKIGKKELIIVTKGKFIVHRFERIWRIMSDPLGGCAVYSVFRKTGWFKKELMAKFYVYYDSSPKVKRFSAGNWWQDFAPAPPDEEKEKCQN